MNKAALGSTTILLMVLCASIPAFAVAASDEERKLSTPEFTAQYVDHSYDIPPVYGTDPYTGLPTIQQQGRHVANRTIEFTIKNQPFTAYKDKNGNEVNLYYAIHAKGHYGDRWGEILFPPSGEFASTKTKASSSEYTVISYAYEESSWGIRDGGQVDFQVEALAGYSYIEWNMEHIQPFYEGTYFQSYGESDWSSTQTVSIPANSQFAGLTLIMAGFFAFVALIVTVVVIVILVVLKAWK